MKFIGDLKVCVHFILNEYFFSSQLIIHSDKAIVVLSNMNLLNPCDLYNNTNEI